MKVGIGVPTVGQRAISDGYTRHATRPTLLHIQHDSDRLGAAWARNQCIATLYDSGCDLIVLMDDDCYPIVTGWQDYLIDGMAEHGLHCILLADQSGGHGVGGLLLVDSPVGCFIALTRYAVETVGYYSAAFSGYGFEDTHYRDRVARSGINPASGRSVSLPRLSEFIMSEDVVKPPCANEYANLTRAEKDREIERNAPVYFRELADPRIYRNREGL